MVDVIEGSGEPDFGAEFRTAAGPTIMSDMHDMQCAPRQSCAHPSHACNRFTASATSSSRIE